MFPGIGGSIEKRHQTDITHPEAISPIANAKKNPFRIPASPLMSNWKNDLMERGGLPFISNRMTCVTFDM